MDGTAHPNLPMPSLLSYVRPFRYDRVSRIVLVETGPTHLVAGVLEELDRIFPDAHTEVLLREEDSGLAAKLKADRVHVVRFEERADLVRALRSPPFDLVVMQLSKGGAQGLRSLPFVVRGHTLMAFNDSLDHFPLNVFRLPDLASHFGLASQGAGMVLAPVVFVYLLVSTAWIRVRGAWRRLRRRSDASIPSVRSAAEADRSSEVERTRAATGSESV